MEYRNSSRVVASTAKNSVWVSSSCQCALACSPLHAMPAFSHIFVQDSPLSLKYHSPLAGGGEAGGSGGGAGGSVRPEAREHSAIHWLRSPVCCPMMSPALAAGERRHSALSSLRQKRRRLLVLTKSGSHNTGTALKRARSLALKARSGAPSCSEPSVVAMVRSTPVCTKCKVYPVASVPSGFTRLAQLLHASAALDAIGTDGSAAETDKQWSSPHMYDDSTTEASACGVCGSGL